MKKHTIELSQEQRAELEEVVRRGNTSARMIQHVHVLLKSDSGPLGPKWSDAEIGEACGVGESTYLRIRRRFVQDGLTDALHRRPQPQRPHKRKINGEHEARLIALTCGAAPDGYKEKNGVCAYWPSGSCCWIRAST